MPELTYRFATERDVPDVVALVEAAYRGAESLSTWTSEAELVIGQRTDAAMVQALLDDPRSSVLLAEEGDALLACCELREPSPEGVAYFGMFAVRPALQSGGYGRVVLAEAERVARAQFGATALELTVIKQRTELIGWYERRGYQRTGELKPFPYGDDRFGIPQVDDLEFATLRKPLT